MELITKLIEKYGRTKTKHVKADKSHPFYWICTVGGLGLLPASGTWGSVAALPLAFVLQSMGGNNALTLGIVAVCLIGTLACNWFERTTNTHDASDIVIDEVAGMMIALIFLPFSIKAWGLAFICFRFFDIVKPWPIGHIDRRLNSGWGVMLDDIIAGFYALGATHYILAAWS